MCDLTTCKISSSEDDPLAGDDEDRDSDFHLSKDSRIGNTKFTNKHEMRLEGLETGKSL